MFTYDEDIFSDLYKEAHGFRPRNHYFYTASPEEKQQIWNELVRELDAVVEDERNREQQSIREFEGLVIANMELGAENREQAVKWIIEGYGEDCVNDREYFCYKFGLPYNYKF